MASPRALNPTELPWSQLRWVCVRAGSWPFGPSNSALLRMDTIPTFEIPRAARYEEIVNSSGFSHFLHQLSWDLQDVETLRKTWIIWRHTFSKLKFEFSTGKTLCIHCSWQVVPSVDSVRLVYAFQMLCWKEIVSISFEYFDLTSQWPCQSLTGFWVNFRFQHCPLQIFAIRILITHDKHVLCPGPTGTGKSPLILLQKGALKKWWSTVITWFARCEHLHVATETSTWELPRRVDCFFKDIWIIWRSDVH